MYTVLKDMAARQRKEAKLRENNYNFGGCAGTIAPADLDIIAKQSVAFDFFCH